MRHSPPECRCPDAGEGGTGWRAPHRKALFCHGGSAPSTGLNRALRRDRRKPSRSFLRSCLQEFWLVLATTDRQRKDRTPIGKEHSNEGCRSAVSAARA